MEFKIGDEFTCPMWLNAKIKLKILARHPKKDHYYCQMYKNNKKTYRDLWFLNDDNPNWIKLPSMPKSHLPDFI